MSPRTGLFFTRPPDQVAAGQLQVPLVLGEDPEAVLPGAEAQRVQLVQLRTPHRKKQRLSKIQKKGKMARCQISPDLELLLSSYWVPLVALEGHVGLFDGHAVHPLHDLQTQEYSTRSDLEHFFNVQKAESSPARRGCPWCSGSGAVSLGCDLAPCRPCCRPAAGSSAPFVSFSPG